MDHLRRIDAAIRHACHSCTVCGSSLYLTSRNEKKLTFHCISEHAASGIMAKTPGLSPKQDSIGKGPPSTDIDF